jgi:hypothetical protein
VSRWTTGNTPRERNILFFGNGKAL